MPDVVEQQESYQANTVAELRDELAARGLHTSGTKDELIARLEEDDAEDAAGESQAQIEAQDEAEVAAEAADEPPDYYPQRVYSPYELPANTAAAQAFAVANPDAVDPDLTLDPPERHDAAVANIQDHVDEMAAVGIIVDDPRVSTGPVPDPSLTAISPEESVVGPPDDITLTATGANFRNTTQIAFGVFSQAEEDAGTGTAGDPKWERTTFVNASTLTTIITAGLFPSADTVPVVIGEPGGTVSSAVDFTFTEPAPLSEPAPEEQ